MSQAIHAGYPGGIAGAIKEALSQIDAAAGEARKRYITSVAGQAETYLAKYEAAVAYQDNPLNESVWLTSEADATGESVAAVAALVIANRDAWVAKGAEIEGTRLYWKQQARGGANVKAVFDTMGQALDELATL